MDGVAENFHTEQNRALLESLATQTGGRYWQPQDLSKLASEIPYSEAGITIREAKDLWNMPIVFLVAAALALFRMAVAPEMGDRVRVGVKTRMNIARLCLGVTCLLMPALSARADSYYVTVAGLGGEPDYEQRFTELAKDLDKLFKGSGRGRPRVHAQRCRCHPRAFDGKSLARWRRVPSRKTVSR